MEKHLQFRSKIHTSTKKKYFLLIFQFEFMHEGQQSLQLYNSVSHNTSEII